MPALAVAPDQADSPNPELLLWIWEHRALERPHGSEARADAQARWRRIYFDWIKREGVSP